MAAYIVNRIPCTKLSTKNEKTPEERFTGKRCNLSDLKLFGSKIMVLKPKQPRSKWDENTTKIIFVGYDECQKGYRCVNISTRKLCVSRNVKFFDSVNKNNEFCVHDEEKDIEKVANVNHSLNSEEVVSGNDPNNTTVTDLNDTVVQVNEPIDEGKQDISTVEELPENIQQPTRSSSRSRTPFVPFQMGNFCFLAELNSENEPIILREAKKSKNADKWIAATDEEINAQRENGTWKWVDLPSNRKPITAKWVFKVKAAVSKRV